MSFDWTTQEFCEKIRENKNKTMDECKEACRQEEGCNAIIHDNKELACEVGSCAIPLESTSWTPGAVRGYFLKGCSFTAKNNV